MSYKLLLFIFVMTCIALGAQPAVSNYNQVWHSQSIDASESMPCGGGDIGMNVWVEKDELFVYIARSGSFDENNALMKTGRLRIKLFPNAFAGGKFTQELHLQQGYVSVSNESNGITTTIKIWADVRKPVAHVDISSSKKITVEAAYESWRYQDRMVKARENFGNSWKWAAPKNNVYKKDMVGFNGNDVLFYHRNEGPTVVDATVTQQGMDEVKDQLYNPLMNLVFGGALDGSKFVPAGNGEGEYVNTNYKSWKLKSKCPAKEQSLALYLHTAQINDISRWKQSLDSLKKVDDSKSALLQSQQWWRQFWERSFIEIDPANTSSKAWELGRNYQLFRYMLGCNANSAWPTKFNGGLFTVDPVYTDTSMKLTPDYRNWGGGLHTMQNQRLVYFPLIKSGDWDLLQPQLDFYMRILHNAELRTKTYWNHGGACFTEQMENFGLPNYAEYGQKRPEDFDKGLEFNAWLEYEWDTVFEFCLMMLEEQRYTGKDISDKLPFIESCLRFFDEHYQYLARLRGSKVLDGNGKLVLYPGSGAETFKMAYNATSTIAALQTITRRLLALPAQYGNEEERKSWQSLLQRIPEISYANNNGHTTIAPAKLWQRINNTESPQLYPVFPWHIFGVGKPRLDTAINTWNYDTSVVKFRSYIGWKQDNIWAADLGLTSEAWRLATLKLQNSGRRFPAFWGPGFDWVPDHNWGGSGMIGLQEMLLQTDDRRILLFGAWPKDVDVHFKLHAPYNTTVEAILTKGKLVSLQVFPEERRRDVVNMLEASTIR
ncbi:MAG: DUF5703 domain-containing protein [Chitinophagaceae bacterium]